MAEDYALDKSTWTEEDFERMGWHDATVHALAFEPDSWEFFVDLDYILKWVEPDDDDKGYQFWVAPATMVFENVSGLKFDLEPLAALELNGIERTDPQSLDAREDTPSSIHWRWKLDMFNGYITFRSTGFTMYFRRAPILLDTQSISVQDRGGLSFARSSLRDLAT